jgi:hypothetical protein
VFDAVVSFETIEHLDLHQEMMSEIKRVLKGTGMLIISSPNKKYYSVESGYINPFHVKELFRDEFLELARSYFSNVALFGQRVVHGSMIVADSKEVAPGFLSIASRDSEITSTNGLAKPLYDLLLASDATLPGASNTLFEAVVHGMDAAQFYGVHLPDRVTKADELVAELHSECEHGRQLLEDEQTRAHGIELELKQTAARSKEVDLELVQTQVRARETELELEQARTKARFLEDALTSSTREIASLQQRVHFAEASLASMYRSTSWRITAPVRWAKSIWMRFIHG